MFSNYTCKKLKYVSETRHTYIFSLMKIRFSSMKIRKYVRLVSFKHIHARRTSKLYLEIKLDSSIYTCSYLIINLNQRQ